MTKAPHIEADEGLDDEFLEGIVGGVVTNPKVNSLNELDAHLQQAGPTPAHPDAPSTMTDAAAAHVAGSTNEGSFQGVGMSASHAAVTFDTHAHSPATEPATKSADSGTTHATATLSTPNPTASHAASGSPATSPTTVDHSVPSGTASHSSSSPPTTSRADHGESVGATPHQAGLGTSVTANSHTPASTVSHSPSSPSSVSHASTNSHPSMMASTSAPHATPGSATMAGMATDHSSASTHSLAASPATPSTSTTNGVSPSMATAGVLPGAVSSVSAEHIPVAGSLGLTDNPNPNIVVFPTALGYFGNPAGMTAAPQTLQGTLQGAVNTVQNFVTHDAGTGTGVGVSATQNIGGIVLNESANAGANASAMVGSTGASAMAAAQAGAQTTIDFGKGFVANAGVNAGVNASAMVGLSGISATAGVQAGGQAGIDFAGHGSLTAAANANANATATIGIHGINATGTAGVSASVTGTQMEQGALVGGLSGSQATTISLNATAQATGNAMLSTSGLSSGGQVQVGEALSVAEQGALSFGGVTASGGATFTTDAVGAGGNVSASFDNGNINLGGSATLDLGPLGGSFNANLQIPTGPIISGLTTAAEAAAPALQDAASAVASVGQDVGSAISSAASDVGNALNPGRVICTHFYRKGMLDRASWRADLEFTHRYLSPATVRGYQFWAIPYVRLMRRSRLAERIMYPIAKYRAAELAYRMGITTKGSLLGKFFRLTIEPICFCIGCVVGEQDWRSLWKGTELEAIAR
jgi:hypothetical protein